MQFINNSFLSYLPFYSNEPPVVFNPPHENIPLISDFKTFEIDVLKQHQQHLKKIFESDGTNTASKMNFIMHLVEKHLEKDREDLVLLLTNCIPFNVLENIFKQDASQIELDCENFQEWFKTKKKPVKFATKPHLLKRISNEWKKYRPGFVHFVPDIIDLFSAALDQINVRKKYKPFWDRYLAVGVLCNLLMVPYAVSKLIQPYITSALKVYGVTFGVIFGITLAVAVYQKFFKPMPHRFANCTNLDHEAQMGRLENAVGNCEKVNELCQHLASGSSVLLVGKTGEGKSGLIRRFVYLKQEGKLPFKLNLKHIHKLNAISTTSTLAAASDKDEVYAEIRSQMKGYEDKLILVVDEFDLITNSAAFGSFKQYFLTEEPVPLVIGLMTKLEYDLMNKQLTDPRSVTRRMKEVFLDSTSDLQIQLILESRVQTETSVPITKEAIEKIVELSRNEKGLQHDGRSDKALQLLQNAIAFCSQYADSNYVHLEVQHIKDQLKAEPEGPHRQELIQNKSKIKNDFKDNQEKLVEVRKKFNFLQHLKQVHSRLYYQIRGDKATSEESKKMFILYDLFFLKCTENSLKNLIDTFPVKFPCQVDANLIETLYKSSFQDEKIIIED